MMAPSFPTHFIADPVSADNRHGALAYFCPWCETVHYHGAAGGGASPRAELRGAHCLDGKSPLAGGSVDLDVVGTITTGDELLPAAPYLTARGDPQKTRLRLRDVLGSGALAAALGRAVFGRFRTSGFDVRLGGGRLHLFDAGAIWFIDDKRGDSVSEGHGLGRLLARLFGVPLGVVAVRVLEDALGEALPAAHRLAVAEIIDQAAAGLPPAAALHEDDCHDPAQ